jgi:tetratricopeptide (TPR) repeat protein
LKSARQKTSRPGDRPASKRRLWLFRLTALLLPVLLLAVLEISLRLGGYGYDPHFFKRLQIGNEDCFVQNDDFSFRFFPPETARNPGPIRMPIHKAPGTFRIFILGESAAMGDPEPAFGAYRYLEMLLREKYPDKKFEIINVAFTAINSHVIVPIARECAAHEGDLWIVYMGNNEMVGPFGAATVFGRQAPPLPYVRLVTALQRTRTGQWIAALSRKLKGHGATATSWGGMQMFLQNQIAPDSPLKENVYRNFQKNLDDIVNAGIHSGAKILLNTVAVNLKDCPPFASLTNQNLSASDRARFEKLYAAGCQSQSRGDFAGAAQTFEQASKLDPQFPDLQFHWGECLLAQTNLAGAREHFQLACDDDALPFRADSRINAAIRDEQKKAGGDNLIMFDAAAALAAGTATKMCGQETFYEHVHFDFDGSYHLALAWADQIEPLLPRNTNAWASQVVCEQMLGLSDWNRALVIEHMIGRMQQPPLSSQTGTAGRVEVLQARVDQLHRQMSAEAAARARESFLKMLERAPDDYVLRENFALFLQSIGDLPAATAEWQRVRDWMPHDYLGHFQIGRLLAGQGRLTEAESSLRQALALRPSLTEGWIELGNVLALQEKFEAALASYAIALKQRPQDAQTHFRSGKVLAKMNRHGEAMENYHAASQLNPADWEAHYELGGELDAANQLDAARTEFGEAARLNPNNARAHFNYGVLLAKQNRLDEAQREFEATLRLDPAYAKAQEYLTQLQTIKTRTP